MIQHLQRFRRFDRIDHRLVLEAAALLVFITIGLPVVRFHRLQRVLDFYARPCEAGRPIENPVRRMAKAVDRAARHLPFAATCLVTALAADAMLRRRGLASRIHLGVLGGPARERFEAHAWVECENTIVTGDIERLPEYVKLSATVSTAPPPLIDALCGLLRRERVSWKSLCATPADVLDVCIRQDLTGLIHERLVAVRHDLDWPPAIREGLAATLRTEVAKEAVRRCEIVATLDALSAEGIAPILLKGAPLAYSLYDAPTSRPRSDTDVLIRREESERVKRVLHGRGYRAPPYCDGELLFCQFELSRTDEFGVEHAFDVHWRISTQVIFADLLGYDELAAESVAVPGLGRFAREPGPVHGLLLACVHPVMHHRSEQRILWIYDAHLLASSLSGPELERFARLAVEKGVAAICAHQLELARLWFGTALSNRTLEILFAPAHTEPSARYLARNRRWHHELIASLRGLPHWTDRLQLAREVLFPNATYMLATYRLPAGSRSAAVLPALYVHRVLSGAWKVLTGRK